MTEPTFGDLLKGIRRRNGLSQIQLAERAGVSPSTIQSYEQGRRIPDARELGRLRSSLSAASEEWNPLRSSAGLSIQPNGLMAALEKSRPTFGTVWDEVRSYEWVSLVTNERKEIVAWNGLANLVGELDLESLPSQMHRSVLRMAATDHYVQRLLNWDELIGRLIGILKDEV